MVMAMPTTAKAMFVALALTAGAAFVPAASPIVAAQSSANLPSSMTLVKPAVLAHSKAVGPIATSTTWHFEVGAGLARPVWIGFFCQCREHTGINRISSLSYPCPTCNPLWS